MGAAALQRCASLAEHAQVAAGGIRNERDEGRDEWCSQPQHSGRLGLYDKLERVIVAMYYSNPDAYGLVMRGAIAGNGSFFNTHRMVSQYLANAWFREDAADRGSGPL